MVGFLGPLDDAATSAEFSDDDALHIYRLLLDFLYGHILNELRIASVTRWGRRGDKQDGIDLKGKWTDGRSAVWQCNGIQPFRQQM
jgi:hypothetical protein